MLKHRGITQERIQKFIEGGQWGRVNLKTFEHLIGLTRSTVKLSMYNVPDLKRISFDEAIKQNYKDCSVGVQFGPSWSTTWFKVVITIPPEMDGKLVTFAFDPSCEGLIWSKDGMPLMGITGGFGGDRHVDFELPFNKAGQTETYWIEVAANGMFGEGNGGMIDPPDPNRYKTLALADLVVYDDTARKILWDLEIMLGISRDMPDDSQISNDALFCANEIVNAVKRGDRSSLEKASALGTEFFKSHWHTGISSHEITAVGNCHIDTAWLWPYDETKRKAARSWATQIGLIEKYPGYKFAASQMQQFEWLKQLYPKLFEKIQKLSKEGSFIPVGGTWVEMDCNMPSGESFCRQFLYGQNFLMENFGRHSRVFWLPDTFGYSAQLPQIIKSAGLDYFFTQKLSWNNINKFPHTSFYWKGLDGTSVLTHFSPADTYTGQVSTRDVTFMVKNNKDKLYSNKSLLLYGNGDGGGGPLQHMLERFNRMQSMEGLGATLAHGDPVEFYDKLASTSKGLNTWKGELYFELHRGTYTSHGIIKKNNRKCEYLLRNVEIMYSLCLLKKVNVEYPKSELDRMWKLLLLNQFHDVLPGSSIEMVYEDAQRFYNDIIATSAKLLEKAVSALQKNSKVCEKTVYFNPTGWPLKNQIIEVPVEHRKKHYQLSANGTKSLVLISEIPAMGTSTTEDIVDFDRNQEIKDQGEVAVDSDSDSFVIVSAESNGVSVDNGIIKVIFESNGRISSIVDLELGYLKLIRRELIPPGTPANVFKFYEDIPLYWDAWDVEIYHWEKGWDAGTGSLKIEESGPLRVILSITHPISSTSSLKQNIIMTRGSRLIKFENEIDWNENRQILKVLFPVSITNDVANYETQFGFLQRPTHSNNSWDMAKFEVCAHKYVDFSEHGYGVALLNDSKYGFAVRENVISMSILRAPKAPDEHCDIGKQSFQYALYPHVGSFLESDVVQMGYQFNVPPLELGQFDLPPISMFKINQPTVVLDTIKRTEVAHSNLTLIVRLYESMGGRGTLKFTSGIVIKEAYDSNVLEEKGKALPISKDGTTVSVPYTPFKILTLYLVF